MNRTRILLIVLVLVLIGIYFRFDLGSYLTLETAQNQLARLRTTAAENFLLSAVVYLLSYIVFVGLSIPGALLFTLLGGAVFGLLWGTVLVSFASCIGATLAFLFTRILLRDWVQRRFGDYLTSINRGIERDGVLYLFMIRFAPVFPFFVVNPLVALTRIRTGTFVLTTLAGMLVSTVIFVNAGTELGRIESAGDVLSPRVALSLTVLAVFPLAARKIFGLLQKRRR